VFSGPAGGLYKRMGKIIAYLHGTNACALVVERSFSL